MLNSMRRLAAAALLAAGVASLASGASALPFANGPALQSAAPSNVETVQWRGRGWGGRGWGWGGVGAGFVAGAIVGGALAAPYYYGPGPYYYGPGPYYGPPPAYYGPGPAPAPASGDATAYCAQRFKSYDPSSGTYLGYDGARHPCP